MNKAEIIIKANETTNKNAILVGNTLKSILAKLNK